LHETEDGNMLASERHIIITAKKSTDYIDYSAESKVRKIARLAKTQFQTILHQPVVEEKISE
jgi:hypothetical protein